MRAFVLTGHGGPEKLEFHADWPVPTPREGEALLKVLACGMNNTDINTRTAWYSEGNKRAATTAAAAAEGARDEDASWGGKAITFPRIQGADLVGRVERLGEGGDKALLGRRVLVDVWLRDWADPLNMDKAGYFGSECDGGFAEFCTVDVRQVHPVESPLSDVELATFATANVTAQNMLARAQVSPGDSVLIPGASGGVGSALVQLARSRGATVVAMCGVDKADGVRALGAHAILPRLVPDLPSALEAAIGRRTVTVVADVVGGPAFPRLIEVLARGGRYTCAGAIAGPAVDLDLRQLYLKDLHFTGATVCPPGRFAEVVRAIEKGELKPVVAATFPLEQLHEAQAKFAKKDFVGNIVIQP